MMILDSGLLFWATLYRCDDKLTYQTSAIILSLRTQCSMHVLNCGVNYCSRPAKLRNGS